MSNEESITPKGQEKELERRLRLVKKRAERYEDEVQILKLALEKANNKTEVIANQTSSNKLSHENLLKATKILKADLQKSNKIIKAQAEQQSIFEGEEESRKLYEAKLLSTIETLKEKANIAKTEELEATQKKLSQELSKVEAKVKKFQATTLTQSDTVKQLKENLIQTQTKYTHEKTKNAEISKKINTTEACHKNIQKGLTEKDQKIKSLEEELQKKLTLLRKTHGQTLNLKLEQSAGQDQVHLLNSEVEQRASKIQLLKEELSALKYKNNHQKLDLSDSLAPLNKEISTLKIERNLLQDKLEHQQVTQDKVDEKKEDIQPLIDSLKQEKSLLKETADNLRHQLEHVREELAKEKVNYERLKSEEKFQEMERIRNNEEKIDATKNNQKLNKIVTNLDESLTKIHKENLSLKKELLELKQINQTLSNQENALLTSLKAHNAELMRKFDRYEDDFQEDRQNISEKTLLLQDKQKELELKEQKIELLNERLKEAKSQYDSFRNRLKESQDIESRLRSKLKEELYQNKETHRELKQSQNEKSNIESCLEMTRHKLIAHQADHEKLQKQYNDISQKLAKTEFLLTEVKNFLKQTQEHNTELIASNKDLKNNFKESQKRWQKAENSLLNLEHKKQLYTKEFELSQESLAQARDQFTQLESDYAELKFTHAQINVSYQELSQTHKTLEKKNIHEKDKEMKTLLNFQNQLQEKLNYAQDEKQRLETEWNRSEKHCLGLEKDLEHLSEAQFALKNKFKEQKQELEGLHESYQELSQAYETLEKKGNHKKDEEIQTLIHFQSQLQEKLNCAQDEKHRLEHELNTSEKHYLSLEKDAEHLNKAQSKLESKHEELKQTYQTLEKKNVHEKDEAVKKFIHFQNQLQEKLNCAQDEKHRLETELNLAEKNCLDLEKNAKHLNEAQSELDSQHEKQKQELKELHKSHQEIQKYYNEQNDELKKYLKEVPDYIQKTTILNEELNKERENSTVLVHGLENAEITISHLREEKNEEEKIIKNLDKKKDQLEKENHKLHKIITKQSSSIKKAAVIHEQNLKMKSKLKKASLDFQSENNIRKVLFFENEGKTCDLKNKKNTPEKKPLTHKSLEKLESDLKEKKHEIQELEISVTAQKEANTVWESLNKKLQAENEDLKKKLAS